MIYLLDTDIVNYLLRGHPRVEQRFAWANHQSSEFVLSACVHFELTRYANLKGHTDITRRYNSLVSDWRFVGLANEDWNVAADLWAERHRAGRPIQDSDLLIAVSALKSGATLVTNNTRHFLHLGVELENWAV